MTNLLEEQPHPRHALTSPAPRLRLHASATAVLDRSSPEPAEVRTRREAGGSGPRTECPAPTPPELAGVHAPADLADEFLRWCL